ncbi:MAG: hypothetical protein GY822_08490 [Deltaproteobacteria bacterium]|nr:hypothetical protein [Deltaproteobacteria bacterium]
MSSTFSQSSALVLHPKAHHTLHHQKLRTRRDAGFGTIMSIAALFGLVLWSTIAEAKTRVSVDEEKDLTVVLKIEADTAPTFQIFDDGMLDNGDVSFVVQLPKTTLKTEAMTSPKGASLLTGGKIEGGAKESTVALHFISLVDYQAKVKGNTLIVRFKSMLGKSEILALATTRRAKRAKERAKGKEEIRLAALAKKDASQAKQRQKAFEEKRKEEARLAATAILKKQEEQRLLAVKEKAEAQKIADAKKAAEEQRRKKAEEEKQRLALAKRAEQERLAAVAKKAAAEKLRLQKAAETEKQRVALAKKIEQERLVAEQKEKELAVRRRKEAEVAEREKQKAALAKEKERREAEEKRISLEKERVRKQKAEKEKLRRQQEEMIQRVREKQAKAEQERERQREYQRREAEAARQKIQKKELEVAPVRRSSAFGGDVKDLRASPALYIRTEGPRKNESGFGGDDDRDESGRSALALITVKRDSRGHARVGIRVDGGARYSIQRRGETELVVTLFDTRAENLQVRRILDARRLRTSILRVLPHVEEDSRHRVELVIELRKDVPTSVSEDAQMLWVHVG